MSKGILSPKYLKGIEDATIDEYRLKWVKPTHLPSEQKKYKEIDELKKDILSAPWALAPHSITLDRVRTWTMHWYYKKTGEMPPATQYKRNASTIFAFLKDRADPAVGLGIAIEELKNLWY